MGNAIEVVSRLHASLFWAQTKLCYSGDASEANVMLSPDNLFQSLSVAFAANFNDCIKAEFHLRFTPFYWRCFATVDLFLLSWRISSTKLNSNWAFKCFLRIASSKFFPVETHFFNFILIFPLMSPWLFFGRNRFWIWYNFFDCHPKSCRCFSCNISENIFFPLNTGSIVYR